MSNKVKPDDVVTEGTWAKTVSLRGADVRIRKCRVRDTKLITDLIKTVATELKLTTAGEIGVTLSDAGNILQLVSILTEQIFEAASVLTDKGSDFLQELELDEGIKVVMEVYELNKRFFMEQVYPVLGPLQQLLKQPSDKQPSEKSRSQGQR